MSESERRVLKAIHTTAENYGAYAARPEELAGKSERIRVTVHQNSLVVAKLMGLGTKKADSDIALNNFLKILIISYSAGSH